MQYAVNDSKTKKSNEIVPSETEQRVIRMEENLMKLMESQMPMHPINFKVGTWPSILKSMVCTMPNIFASVRFGLDLNTNVMDLVVLSIRLSQVTGKGQLNNVRIFLSSSAYQRAH